MMSTQRCVEREFCGRVIDIMPKYKAIVEFELENKTERALLWYKKLKVNGEPLPQDGTIGQYLLIGTSVKFLCHEFDDTGKDRVTFLESKYNKTSLFRDFVWTGNSPEMSNVAEQLCEDIAADHHLNSARCGWYITCAWKLDARLENLKNHDTVFNGLYHCKGQILEVACRQGKLTYSANGQDICVLFLASNLFISGKRVSAKANLMEMPGMEKGRLLMFDAVPSDPADDGSCQWFATVAWWGRKPAMEYDDTKKTENPENPEIPQLTLIKQVTSNPHSLFFCGEGRVIKIVSAEYGLALCAIKKNKWESVLFHRSNFVLFDRNLANDDLTTILKLGDKLRIVAAAAPDKRMGARWLASQVRLFIHPSVAHKFQFGPEPCLESAALN